MRILATLLLSGTLIACDAASGLSGAMPGAERPTGSEHTSLDEGRAVRIYYQFTDDRGSVRFVESLDQVPEAWRERVGFVEMSGPPPTSPMDMKRAMAPDYSKLAAASGATAKTGPKIVLYGADWCPACVKAKAWLQKNGHAFEDKNVDQPGPSKELVEKSGGRSIPVIEVNGRIIRGFNPGALQKLIDEA